MDKTKKLVITGALGHIGSELIRSFKPATYNQIVLVDNLSTQRYCSLFNLPKGVPFTFIEEDICTSDLEKIFSGADTVIHLAAITEAAGSFQNQELVEKVNYSGTERVAKACVACGCKLLFVSTTSVYSAQADSIVDENYPVGQFPLQSPYAESKLRAEKALQLLGEKEGLQFIICRFGTIYGISIGMRFHTAVNKFVWQACLGKPLSIWRTALEQRRPYLELQDSVGAINFILRKDCFYNQVYNLATDNLSVAQIIKTIKVFIPDVKIDFIDSEAMNQLSYSVTCEKFRALGFSFKGDFKKSIKEAIILLNGICSKPF